MKTGVFGVPAILLGEGVINDSLARSISLALAVGLIVIVTINVLNHYKWRKYPHGPSRMEALRGLVIYHGHILKYKEAWKRRFGQVYSLLVGRGQIILTDYETMHDAFVRHADVCSLRPLEYAMVTTRSETGLHLSPHYKEQRKFAQTALREQGKMDMEHKILEEIYSFFKEVEAHKEEPQDVDGYTHQAVGNVICNIVLGSRFSYDDPVFISILHRNITWVKYARKAFVVNDLPILKWIPGDLFGYQRFRREGEENRKFFRDVIRQHKETLDEQHPRDFIDAYLIEIKAQTSGTSNTVSFDEENCVSTVIQLFLGGTDSTSSLLQWTWLFMMLNQDIQQKVQSEIDRCIGLRLPSLTDKASLPYTEAVITEVLRLSNTAADTMPHKVDENLKIGKHLLVAGATVLASLSDVHLDDQTYPDPMTFKPERFLSPTGSFEKPKKFVPFGIGRRACIGESLARAEVFLFFVSVLQNFSLVAPPGSNYKAEGKIGLVHMPNPYKVIFKRRHSMNSDLCCSNS